MKMMPKRPMPDADEAPMKMKPLDPKVRAAMIAKMLKAGKAG